jgi:hypothetical protein
LDEVRLFVTVAGCPLSHCTISNYSPSDLKITLIIGFFHTNQHNLGQFPDCWIVASADTKRDSAFDLPYHNSLYAPASRCTHIIDAGHFSTST